VLLRFATALVAVFAVSGPPGGVDVRGTLPEPGVVWVQDDARPLPAAETQMANSDKTFVPGIVVVAAGGSVRFPNFDPFYHSIYSESPAGPFDIGFYDNGPGKAVAFERTGVIAVRCHIHGSMHGTIVVVGGPWAQTTAPGEGYVIPNVPPGRHTLHVWTPDGGEKISEITL
jgi:plastocyanin